MIVGICGPINSGKDTVADILCNEFNFLRVAFADSLKDFCLRMFPDILDEETLWGPSEKRTPKCRHLLQQLGTDVARQFDPDVWVKHTMNRIGLLQHQGLDALGRHLPTKPNRSIVVSDVRFLNEAEGIRAQGGFLLSITRPDNYDLVNTEQAARTHKSETSIFEIPPELFTDHIVNNKTLEDLRIQTQEVLLGLLKP